MIILYVGTAVFLAALNFLPDVNSVLIGVALTFYGYCVGRQGAEDRALRDNRVRDNRDRVERDNKTAN